MRCAGSVVATLGPNGTNSEKAAHEYIKAQGLEGSTLRLFRTFEEACDALMAGDVDVVIACTAYLKFSALYFERVPAIKFVSSFVIDLDEMVIARRPGGPTTPATLTVQPAIWPLIRRFVPLDFVPADSNASAAVEVSHGRYALCLTTATAAAAHGLEVVVAMPPLQMPFAVITRSPTTGSNHGAALTRLFHPEQP